MRKLLIIISPLILLLLIIFLLFDFKPRRRSDAPGPVLLKEYDLTKYDQNIGFYPSFGDLDNDGKMDILLHRVGSRGEAKYLIAIDYDGEVLWKLGDSALSEHKYWKHEPPNRALAIIYDIDHDGHSEVVAETSRDSTYRIEIVNGKTGEIQKSIESPFNELSKKIITRAHPMAFIAYMDGYDSLPTIVVKYEASNQIKGIAIGYDKDLNAKWVFQNNEHSVGHIPDIADIDYDSKEEVCIGYAVIDDNGSALWEADLPQLMDAHADFVTTADILPNPGKEILIAECKPKGKAYCFSSGGELIWKNDRNCNHTECIWAGNFINDLPGVELIIQNRAHRAVFMSANAQTGKKIKNIRFSKNYTDWPTKISWVDKEIQSMWMPLERKLYDGYGEIIQDLGKYDKTVQEHLGAGVTKEQLGVQAIGLDIYGDSREEIVIYQPFQGKKIYIFTQHDSNGKLKEYIPQKQAYNMRTIH
ncbi:MAG: hypothetical protein JW894_13425 [Bacteroidales bacterium]|nr:hypothetical protein [Bacteroidales bacterium]